MRPIRLAVAVLSLLFVAEVVCAAEPPEQGEEPAAADGPSSKAALIDGFTPAPQKPSARTSDQDAFALYAPDPATVEPATRSLEQAAWRAYYDYKIRGLRHRSATFEWQLVSSKITFVVVLSLVVAGIYFSWLQFRSSLPPRPAKVSIATAEAKPADAPPAEASMMMAVTEISAGRDGIKVSSPVLGIIILVVSLLFFYLYLVYIYPIHEMF